jgi:alpha-ketoglutarate-dependent taurine dioxygenase
MFEVHRLDAPFGVAISGIDLAAKGTDPDVIQALAQQLYEHRVIVVTGQRLDEPDYLAFGEQWGRPIVHVKTSARGERFPALTVLGNTGERGRDDNKRLAATFWHTDQSYESDPATVTMLYSVMAPRNGGETDLADLAGAYRALPAALRAQVDGLDAMHAYGAAAGQDGEFDIARTLSDIERQAVPPVRHPLVLTHPVTGHKALYAVAGTPFAIPGMPQDEAQDLLRTLKQHALQPQFRYRHSYAVGEVILWDTLSTLHSATPIAVATSAEDSRLLWRISCRGLPVPFTRPTYRGRVIV